MWSFYHLLLVLVLLVCLDHTSGSAAPTASPTNSACPSGYSALSISGYSSICTQFVTASSSITQAAFNTLCSSSYNGGYLVQISNTATRDALLTYVAGLQSANNWNSDKDIWVGVQLTSASTVGAKTAYSPYGTAQTSAYNVTSIFLPYSTTALWVATNEPAAGDVSVSIQFKNSGSLIKFKGRTSSDSKQYGIW